jgi:hypothetical protein
VLMLSSRLPDPRVSIAGRFSRDDVHEHPLHSAGHGRRSSLFRQQSSSLFDAFNEESVGLTEQDEDDERDRPRGAKPHAHTNGVPPGARTSEARR